MASPIRPTSPSTESLPTVPTAESWRAMTPTERLRLQVEINATLSGPADAMGEGQPHRRAKSRALDALGLHFKTIGRAIYLAEELAVLYPGEKPFSPDILAVLDVEPSEDDERMSWVVVDEGKGPDLVIEVLHRGDRDKDLVENVERYARLGISEYFVYDRARQQIHGYRLPEPGASRYQRILPQLGHCRSAVLGLDLAIIGNTLRFLSGEATLPLSADLISRLQGMVESLETKADQAQAQIDQAQARADQAQARVDQAIEGLREALLAILDLRAIPCSEAARARIAASVDPSVLRQWLLRATMAVTAEDIFLASPKAL
ncbi:MAG: Uma2 family endonuclease [Byssovorax sp.]